MQPCIQQNCCCCQLQQAAVNLHAGTYAEYATIKSSLLANIPDNTSFDQAAALPLVSLTAMQVSIAGIMKQAVCCTAIYTHLLHAYAIQIFFSGM